MVLDWHGGASCRRPLRVGGNRFPQMETDGLNRTRRTEETQRNRRSGGEMTDSQIKNWVTSVTYKDGDLITMKGCYKRRTFWQWLMNNPKELQKFRIIGTGSTQPGGITRYAPTR